MENGNTSIQKLKELICKKYQYDVSESTIESCIWNLNFKFVREKFEGRLLSVKDVYNLKIINIVDGNFALENEFKKWKLEYEQVDDVCVMGIRI